MSRPPLVKFFRAKPKQAGKKEGGLSVIPTRNFCPPVFQRFGNSALAEYQNRKIFVSLIEKKFWGHAIKKC
jgi:hypothetical protein